MTALALDLTNINTDKLVDELKRRREAEEITPEMLGFEMDAADLSASALLSEFNTRLRMGEVDIDDIDPPLDVEPYALNEAAARFARRDYPETLWNLEKALGAAFAGLGNFTLEKRT